MSKPIDQELLPCPLCGDVQLGFMDMTYMHADGPVKGKRVKCQTCGCQAPDTAWNHRAAVQPAGEAVPDAVLVDREWLCELQKYVSSFEKQDELRSMLAAAPHPVIGEQKAEPRPSWLDGGAEAVAMAKEDEANVVAGMVKALTDIVECSEDPGAVECATEALDAYRDWKGGE